MARTLEQIIAGLPDHRREHIEDRADELMTLRKKSLVNLPFPESGFPRLNVAEGEDANEP